MGNKINKEQYPSVEGIAKKGKNYNLYLGIACDEQKRIVKNSFYNKNVYPLVEWQITEKKALQYCYSKGFNWNGLYEDFVRVSCWCCPFSRIGELRTLYNKYPKLWNDLKKMDKYSWRQFRNDYTVDQLDKKFRREKNQLRLF